MKSSLPAILLASVFVATVAASLWGQQDSTLAEGRFLVEPETITEASGLFVKRLKIVANGAKGVRLTHGAADASWLNLTNAPTADDGLQHVHLVFVADRSLDLGTDQCSITWLNQITTPAGARIGGPSRYAIPRDTKIDEFVELKLPQGEYDVGDTLSLGIVNGQPVEVEIERIEPGPEQNQDGDDVD